MDRLNDFKLGTGLVIKAENDWRDEMGGLKLQCIAIATFSDFISAVTQVKHICSKHCHCIRVS